MTPLILTNHGTTRIAQRGIQLQDAELITWIGTEVKDGYLVRQKDYQEVEREVKAFLQRIKRLVGKRLVVINGQIITGYHSSQNNCSQLLRHAYDSDLKID